MKKIILTVMLLLSIVSGRSLWDSSLIHADIQWLNNNMDIHKLNTLRELYNACLPYNMEYTCMAIAWQESFIGEVKINSKSGDYGLTGINLKTYINDNNLHLSYWGIQKLKTKLVVNDDFAIGVMIKLLRYWYKVRHGDWYKIWESYNAGFGYNPSYPKAIYNKIIALKIWLKRNNINLNVN